MIRWIQHPFFPHEECYIDGIFAGRLGLAMDGYYRIGGDIAGTSRYAARQEIEDRVRAKLEIKALALQKMEQPRLRRSPSLHKEG